MLMRLVFVFWSCCNKVSLGGLNNRNGFFHNSGSSKSESKVLSVPGPLCSLDRRIHPSLALALAISGIRLLVDPAFVLT